MTEHARTQPRGTGRLLRSVPLSCALAALATAHSVPAEPRGPEPTPPIVSSDHQRGGHGQAATEPVQAEPVHAAVIELRGPVGLFVTGQRIREAAQHVATSHGAAIESRNGRNTDVVDAGTAPPPTPPTPLPPPTPPTPPPLLVLRLDSPGGRIAALPDISDAVFEARTELGVRVVVWVERATSAAAIAAINAPEIVMHPAGTIGGAVATDDAGGALTGDDLQRVLFIGEASARRGSHDPLIARAMQTGCGLVRSADGTLGVPDDAPEPDTATDGHSRIVLAASGQPLVMNARGAADAGMSIGEARSFEELLDLLGIPDDGLQRLTEVEAADASEHERRAALYDALGPDVRTVHRARRALDDAAEGGPPADRGVLITALDALDRIEAALEAYPYAARVCAEYLQLSPALARVARDTFQAAMDALPPEPR